MHFSTEDYAELLGLYLGDGCISPGARTERLRLHFDTRYPGIVSDARELLVRSLPENVVGVLYMYGGTMALVGVEYRAYPRRIRVNRRESVALLVEHVGIKA